MPLLQEDSDVLPTKYYLPNRGREKGMEHSSEAAGNEDKIAK